MVDLPKKVALQARPPDELSPGPQPPPHHAALHPARRLRGKIRWTLLIVGPLAAVLGVTYFYVTSGRFVAIDNAYVRADKVDIAADIGGTVKSVEVRENQPVRAGDVLYRLDDEQMRIAVDHAQAQLAATRTQIEALKASYREKQESLRQAQIDIAYYSHELDRKADLTRHGAESLSVLDQARHSFDTARQMAPMLNQELAGIVANLGGDPDIAVENHPRMRAAAADLAEAERQLGHTAIRAPFDGIATQVHNVRPGAYLAAAQAAFALVATDHLWIEANPKETDLAHVAPGQRATITVDTYADVAWTGSVDSLSPASGAEFALLPAQNTSGNWVKVVQRIPILIRVDTAPDKPTLRAGMSVQVSIDTGHQRPVPPILSALLGIPPVAQAANPTPAR
jgi:membrane fusion protein (multidrug efflux system)